MTLFGLPIRYIIIFLVLVHLAFYFFKTRRKKGVCFDYWLYVIVTSNIIWYFLIFPFSFDEMQSISTGGFQFYIRRHLNQAFDIMFCGYIFMWIGKFCYDYKKRYVGVPTVNIFEKCIRFVFYNKQIRVILILLFAPVILYDLYQGYKNFGSDLRVVMGSDGITRIFNNMVSTIYPFFMALYAILYYQERKTSYLRIFIVLFCACVFFSSRGMMFSLLPLLVLFYAVSNVRKVSIAKVGIFAILIIVGVIMLNVVRTGGEAEDSFMDSILYGNTFSDIRDFAWILNGWKGDYLYGKTYLAGIMSFVPSTFSDFRTEYGLGRVALSLAGIEVESFHGGLRGTIFFESFINFGIIGVIIFSFFYGYFTECINKKVMYHLINRQFINAYASASLGGILFTFMISSGFFGNYVKYIPILILYKIFYKRGSQY